MPKIQKPDRKFVYISPLKACENENARLIAGLVEQFMIDNIEMQIKNWKLLTGNFIKSLLTGNYIKTLLIGITSSKIDAFVGFGMTKMMKILSPDWKLLIWMTIICALKAKTALRGEIVALSTKMK